MFITWSFIWCAFSCGQKLIKTKGIVLVFFKLNRSRPACCGSICSRKLLIRYKPANKFRFIEMCFKIWGLLEGTADETVRTQGLFYVPCFFFFVTHSLIVSKMVWNGNKIENKIIFFSLAVQFDWIDGFFCSPIFVQNSQKTNWI